MQSDILKITLLGDDKVGKTCFLFRLVLNDFPDTDYLPSTFPGDVNAPSYTINKGQVFTLRFNDPVKEDHPSQEDHLNDNSYLGTDLFVILYDVSNRESLRNILGLHEKVAELTPNTPVLLVGNKIDLRKPENGDERCLSSLPVSSEDKELITTTKEACDVAETMGTICLECSAYSGQGVHEAAHVMVQMAVYGQKPRGNLFKRKDSKRQKIDIPWDSLILDSNEFYGMGNAPPCPGVNVLPSRSVEDLAKVIHDTTCKDVRFIFHDDSTVDAHQIILISAAPKLFQDILTGTAKSRVSGLPQELFEKVSWPIHAASDHDHTSSDQIVEIRVCKEVKRNEFLRLLEFLYAGASMTYLRSEDSIYELLAIAKTFQLQELVTACENVLEGNEQENIQKTTFVGGGKATILKDMFLKKPLLEDLVFQVQGNLMYAHQAVVVARSHVLAAMVTSYRTQNVGCVRVKIEITEVFPETFNYLLEYLYTDDVPKYMTQEILTDLLALANKYELPRLVTLCEYRLILKIQDISDSNKAVSAVIDILFQAKAHKARQLSKWCLNLISRNYSKFCCLKEILRLTEEDREYVDKHQWPQKCYLAAQHTAIVKNYLDKREIQFQSNCSNRCSVM